VGRAGPSNYGQQMADAGGQLRGLWILGGAALLGACSIMPVNGPASRDVVAASADVVPSAAQSLDYAVVRVTPEAEGIIAEYNPRISGTFPDRQAPKELKFGIGDIVSVSIFESSSARGKRSPRKFYCTAKSACEHQRLYQRPLRRRQPEDFGQGQEAG